MVSAARPAPTQLCPQHLANQMAYWHAFWNVEAIEGHEDEVASIVERAELWRERKIDGHKDFRELYYHAS